MFPSSILIYVLCILNLLQMCSIVLKSDEVIVNWLKGGLSFIRPCDPIEELYLGDGHWSAEDLSMFCFYFPVILFYISSVTQVTHCCGSLLVIDITFLTSPLKLLSQSWLDLVCNIKSSVLSILGAFKRYLWQSKEGTIFLECVNFLNFLLLLKIMSQKLWIRFV